MSTTASQKIGAILLPLSAAGLGILTSGPEWTVHRTQRSMQESLERQTAAKAAAAAAAAAPAVDAPAAGPGAGAPGPSQAPKNPASSPPPKPAAPSGPKEPEARSTGPGGGLKQGPPSEKPALPAVDEIEFRVGGLCTARAGLPLRVPAADRLDIHVTTSGNPRIGSEYSSPEMAREAIQGADPAKKEKGMLFLVPNRAAPWDAVRDLAAAGAAAGWGRITLCVGHPDNPGQGRVLAVVVPGNEAPEPPKGVDPFQVRVLGMGPAPSFQVNGEECKDAAALEAKVKAIHEEYEASYEGYTSEADTSPWIVDGSGAASGGVIAALDAVLAGGVKSVRLAGIHRAAAK